MVLGLLMLVMAVVVVRLLFYSFILMRYGCGSCCERLLFYSFILIGCGCESCDNGLLCLVVAMAGCDNVCLLILIGCGGF